MQVGSCAMTAQDTMLCYSIVHFVLRQPCHYSAAPLQHHLVMQHSGMLQHDFHVVEACHPVVEGLCDNNKRDPRAPLVEGCMLQQHGHHAANTMWVLHCKRVLIIPQSPA